VWIERVLVYGLALFVILTFLGCVLYGATQQMRTYRRVALFRQQMTQGYYYDALETIKQAININRYDGQCYLQQAQAHVKLRDYQAALDDYNLALRHSRTGDEAAAYAGRASVYCCLEQYNDALVDANHAIACNRHAWYAYVARGHAYLGLEHYKVALDDFEQAQQLAIETKAPICYGLALALYAATEYGRAIGWAQQAVVLDAENADACALLGGILVGCERLEEARAQLEQALRLNPQLARVYFYLAQLHFAELHYAEAQTALVQCVKMEQPQVERKAAQILLTSLLRR